MLQLCVARCRWGEQWAMSMQTTMTAVRICRCRSTAPACPILSLFIALTGDSALEQQMQNTLHGEKL